MISHDRWLLDRIATHILAFEDDGTQVQSNDVPFGRPSFSMHSAALDCCYSMWNLIIS